MKKGILLIIFCVLGIQLSYSSQMLRTRLGKRDLTEIQKHILNFNKNEDIPSSTPRPDSPKRLQTPRTPRVSEKYYIPYFFDGTDQYIFLKKNDDKEVALSNQLLILVSEKDQFKKKIEDLFTVRFEQDETVWLEKKPGDLEKMNNEYESYLVDDNRLSEEIKKQIKFVVKKASFVPLFYQITNEQLNVLIKEKQLVEEEKTTPKIQLKNFLPKEDDLSENGSKKEIEQKINAIIEQKFKYAFLPIVISANSSHIVFMQMIDVSDGGLHDVLEKKEYVSLSLNQVLSAVRGFSNKNTLSMKGYLKNVYTKLTSETNENKKIDTSFVELFMKEYKEHEQNVQETVKRDKAQKEAEKSKKEKEIIAKQKEIERKEREAKQRVLEQEETALLATVTPSVPKEIVQNLKPTEVIKQEQHKKKQIKQKLKENKTELTTAIKPKPQPSEIKQKPRSKSQGQSSSANVPFKKYPPTLNHMNQIIAFVSNLFDKYHDGKTINEQNIIACSDDIKKGVDEAERFGQVWIALPLNAIKDLKFNQAYDDLKDTGNANIYIKEKLINCIYRSEIKTHAIVFLLFNDQALISSFYNQFQNLHKNKKLYIGLNNSVDNTLLCNGTIVLCSVDSITTWLKDNKASDGSTQQSKSKVGAIFPRLIKSKIVGEQDVIASDNETVLSDDVKKESTLNVAESPIEQEVVVVKNPDTADTKSTIVTQSAENGSGKKEVDQTLTGTDEKPIQLDQSGSNIKGPGSGQLVQENVTENESLSNQVSFFDQVFSFFSDMVIGIKNFFLVTIPSFFN